MVDPGFNIEAITACLKEQLLTVQEVVTDGSSKRVTLYVAAEALKENRASNILTIKNFVDFCLKKEKVILIW